MIRKTIYPVILFLLCFMLTGCAESDIIITIDGTKHAVFCDSKSYKDFSEFENALLELTYENNVGEPVKVFKSVEIRKEGGLFENGYTLNSVTNPPPKSSKGFGDNGKPQIEITMPGKIKESTGGKIDGNTLKIEITDLTQENEITAVSTSANTAGIVITVIVVIFIIGLLYSLSGIGGE